MTSFVGITTVLLSLNSLCPEILSRKITPIKGYTTTQSDTYFTEYLQTNRFYSNRINPGRVFGVISKDQVSFRTV
ncbi:MAG: hypothetical protein DDT32_00725 [Syntrophomonadaceae bacterium]|nr:hypothetical protein [Bacillota bacterium]MBT9146974.1 hypothetical protein [Bacillota bacterium]